MDIGRSTYFRSGSNIQKRKLEDYVTLLTAKIRAEKLKITSTPHMAVDCISFEGHSIIHIQVSPLQEPAFIDGAMYVRNFSHNVEVKGEDILTVAEAIKARVADKR